MSDNNESYFDRVTDRMMEIYAEEDPDTRLEMVEALLESEPDNPLAKYLKWQEMDDEDSVENVNLLCDAVRALKPEVERAEGTENADEINSVYVSMLSDLASYLFFAGEKDRALEVAEEFMKRDREGYLVGRLVYYTILLEKGEFKRVLEAADEDILDTPMMHYARAIALFEQEGPSEDASDALLEAISLDPDMAFYILGLWGFDEEDIEADAANDEEAEYMEDVMMHVSVLSELWSAAEERLAFLGVVAFAFGYMTGRMEGADDMDMLEEGYKNLGCLEEMREARDTLHARIADGKEQEEVDEEALMIFRDMRDRGVFS